MRRLYAAKDDATLGRTSRWRQLCGVQHAALENGIAERYGLQSNVEAVRETRQISKASMVRNAATPAIEVDPETFAVRVDGKHATVPPASVIPLNQLYFFS